ncbi:MAG: phytanoyl-CoA dioxygenase family protein [Caulobacteraceae bacterium]
MNNQRPHPLNRDFRWEKRPTEGLRRLTPPEVAQFDQRGFARLEGVFSEEELEAVIAAIDPIEARRETWLKVHAGGKSFINEADVITFTTHLVVRSPVLRGFAADRKIQAICHDLIGPRVRLYWDQAVYKKTGRQQEFPWHQDNGYTFIEPQQYLTLWIPLVDVDEENGCPWVATGLHLGGTLAHWLTDIGLQCLETSAEAAAVPAKAGDIVAFSSLTPHRTGPNRRAGTVRKAYILQYAPDGAETIRDGERIRQDDPERQFLILDEAA